MRPKRRWTRPDQSPGVQRPNSASSCLGLGFRVYNGGLGFRVYRGLGFRVYNKGLGFRVHRGLGLRVCLWVSGCDS